MKNTTTTKEAKIRQSEIIRHLGNAGHDDGAHGRAFELECASAYSRKTHVGLNGEADVYVKVGKGTVKAECKTNGGRIESLLNGSNKAKYVIYRLDLTIEHKAGKTKPAWTEHRHINPVIIPTELFLEALEHFGAIKNTNGNNPERAIQVSSKKWYEWLLDYPMTYKPELRYSEDDFEGLTV